jgi:GNAT superfamily N-acetyltransferase
VEAEGLELRRAGLGDAPALALHRLELVRAVKDRVPEGEDGLLREMEGLIADGLGSDELAAWICLDGMTAAASGAIAFPMDQGQREEERLGQGEALLLGMYTRPAYRRRGLGTSLLALAIGEARARGARAIRLQPTELGRPIYEAVGFRDRGRDMLLEL